GGDWVASSIKVGGFTSNAARPPQGGDASSGGIASMAHWLLKTEPGDYSFADLMRDKRTVWTGVSNPVALKNIRQMRDGDLAFVYHTGDEKQIVGIAEVASD